VNVKFHPRKIFDKLLIYTGQNFSHHPNFRGQKEDKRAFFMLFKQRLLFNELNGGIAKRSSSGSC
jgi:hypothetical protein